MSLLKDLEVGLFSRMSDEQRTVVAKKLTALTDLSPHGNPQPVWADPAIDPIDTVVAQLGDDILGSVSFQQIVLAEPLVLRPMERTQAAIVLLSLIRFLEGVLATMPVSKLAFMVHENNEEGWKQVLESANGVERINQGVVDLYQRRLGASFHGER